MLKKKKKKAPLSFQEILPSHDVPFTIPRQKPPQMAGPFLGLIEFKCGSQGLVRLPSCTLTVCHCLVLGATILLSTASIYSLFQH